MAVPVARDAHQDLNRRQKFQDEYALLKKLIFAYNKNGHVYANLL
jgi:hypothetical protein